MRTSFVSNLLSCATLWNSTSHLEFSTTQEVQFAQRQKTIPVNAPSNGLAFWPSSDQPARELERSWYPGILQSELESCS
jgi:hypothetical protein